MRLVLRTIFLVFVLVASTSFSHAQFSNTFAAVDITLSPQFPQPGQQISASVTSASENTQSATIIWLLNGAILQQERGGVSVAFSAAEVGESQQLSVIVRLPDGRTLSDAITLQSARATLMWEAQTYTHPFFEGNSQYSTGSLVSAEVLTEFTDLSGALIPSEELSYTWRRNGEVLGSLSGVGAQSITLEGPKFFGEDILSVQVSSPDGVQIAESGARITTQDPVVSLYLRDALTGIQFHKAIGSDEELRGSTQIDFQAIPYFMDALSPLDARLLYNWEVNNEEVISSLRNPSVLPITINSNDTLRTTIQLSVEHAFSLLQGVARSWTLQLEQSTRNSLFGL